MSVPASALAPELEALPSEWIVRRVDELFAIQQGKQVSKKNRVGDNQRPFLRTKNVLWGQLDLTELDQMHFSEAEASRLALRRGDLLLCEGGWVGRTAMWQGELPICYYQNHLHRMRAREDTIDPQFALYWFWHAFELSSVYFGRKNVTTIPNMSKSRLGELPMPQPPLDEQRKIAAVLSGVQRAIEQQERLIGLTTELKKALMHKLFTEGTRGEPQKQTEIGPIPQSWSVVTFDEFAVLQRGKDLPKSSFRDGEIPVIGATKAMGTHDTANVRGPGVTVVRSGSSAGKPLFIPSDFWAHNVVLYVKDFRGNDPKFVYYQLMKLDLTRFKAGVAVPTLNRNTFRGIRLAVPDLAEQLAIAHSLDTVHLRTTQAEGARDALSDLFRTLLHQLMTAQIRVQDVDLGALGQLTDAGELQEVA